MTNHNICATLCSTMLIDTLKHIQARDDLTDGQFAKKLGIHRVSWQRIKSRRKAFGKHFLSCVRQAYPELKDEIDIFLVGEATNASIEVVEVSTTPSEKPQDKNLGDYLRKQYQRLIKIIKGSK